MGKAPSFQFYVRDWLIDPELRKASPFSRGVWIDCLCYMWESDPRGEITSDREGWCRMLGLQVHELDRFFGELQECNFGEIVTDGNGKVTLLCRRMARDEKKRRAGAKRTRRHRAKKGNGQSNDKVTPPSSSSSSVSLLNNKASDRNAVYLTAQGRELKGQKLEDFELVVEAFGSSQDKPLAADVWMDLPGYKPGQVEHIVEAAAREADRRPELKARGQFHKLLPGWLRSRPWESEPDQDDGPGSTRSWSEEEYAQLCQDGGTR